MPDATPRLDGHPVGPAGYAPIAWPAVGSLAVGGLFVALLLALAANAFRIGQPLLVEWLFFFPVVGVILAFVARRMIGDAEGTRTGLAYANAGWWLCVLGGLGYAAYLFAIDFAVSNDARRTLTKWAATVQALDPDNPADPNLLEATYATIAPGQRAQVKGPADAAGLERAFRDDLVRVRQLDVVRVARRSPGAVTFGPFNTRTWQQTPTQMTCTLAGTMTTPEGTFRLVVPMEGVDKPNRQWRVVTTRSGLIESRSLTRLGWLANQLEQTGLQTAAQFASLAATPGMGWAAYDGFVRPQAGGRAPGVAAVAGWAAAASEGAADFDRVLSAGFFTLPGGVAPSADQRATFRHAWDAHRVRAAGTFLRDSPDTAPVLRLSADAAEMAVPIEIALTGSQGGEAARGRLVLRTTDPSVLAELKTARAQRGAELPEPPPDVTGLAVGWRVVRVESDLRGITPPAPPRGGPPG